MEKKIKLYIEEVSMDDVGIGQIKLVSTDMDLIKNAFKLTGQSPTTPAHLEVDMQLLSLELDIDTFVSDDEERKLRANKLRTTLRDLEKQIDNL